MDDAKREIVQAWLLKARHDLLSARRLSEGPNPILDTAIYHCQQAAEKALKALLSYYDQPLQKTHDLGVLLRLALPFTRELSSMELVADRLSRYAVIYRYPSDEPEPEREELDQALEDADTLVATVSRLLPSIVHP